MNYLDPQQVKELAEIIATVAAGLAALFLILRRVKKSGSVFIQFCTDFYAMPSKVKKIESEVTLNGGKGLKDKVVEIAEVLHLQDQRLVLVGDRKNAEGVFETDAAGGIIFTSPGFLQLLGRAQEESLGNNWIHGLHPSCRQEVFTEWRAAITDARIFETMCKLHKDGNPFEVYIRAVPLKRRNGTIQGWFGFVERS